MAKDDDPKYKMTRARTALIVNQPFYGCLALNLRLRPVAGLSTMATDGVTIYYSPKFVKELTHEEIMGVLAHEVTHCAYKHMTRKQYRDARDWNIAADLRINPDLIKAGFRLPGQPRTFQEHLNGSVGYLLDPQFDDSMSTEEIYSIIHQELEKQRSKQQSQDKGDGEGQDQGQGGQGDQDDQGQNGSGSEDPGGCGGILDPTKSEGLTAEEVEANWEALTRQAVMVAQAQNAGNIPGNIERLVRELGRSKVSWKDLLRQFVDRTVKKDPVWHRPNRRHLHTGMIWPGLYDEGIDHVVVVMDTSGSINDDLISEFATEVTAIMNEGLVQRVTVIYADTQVQRVEEFEQHDPVVLDPKGGGGTDFRDTFRWIVENANDSAAVIYFTDLCVREFGEAPQPPVLWAVYGPESNYGQLASNVPFGECVHLHV